MSAPTATGRPYKPDLAGQGKQSRAALLPTYGEAKLPFLYMHCPGSTGGWQVVDGRLTPFLGRRFLNESNGVRKNRDGTLDIRRWAERKRDQGWTILPTDIDGEGTSYCAEWEVSSTGVRGDAGPVYAYLSKFETLIPGSSATTSDVDGFHAWTRSLVDRGLLQRPAPHVLRLLLEKYAEGAKMEPGETRESAARRDLFLANAAVVRDELEKATRQAADEARTPAEEL